MIMSLIDRKQRVLKQLFELNNEATLREIEELLEKTAIEESVSVSESDIDSGKVIVLADFNENMTQWIKEQYTK
ncbi:MAG: hypothetical protein CMC96_03830 [Flavobacteriales bacterium]|nr:hypothetical protein [Flavobacteriales bacterium]|tara:strand:- start:15319 stop:15540 length:222 start_codon:yes stop_codon:yes gene_type:complete